MAAERPAWFATPRGRYKRGYEGTVRSTTRKNCSILVGNRAEPNLTNSCQFLPTYSSEKGFQLPSRHVYAQHQQFR